METTAVTVRLLATDDVPDDLIEAARRLLDDDERARADRFLFERDRRLFTAAHALARLVLSEASPGVAPARWRFDVNRWGRPFLAPPFAASGLHFNLSHTIGLAACATAWHHDVGIDVEDRTREAGGPAIAERFFAAPEVAALRQTAAAAQRELFFRFWTLKEAYIKARGQGISLGLDRFWFDLSDAAPRIGWDDGLDERPASWRFLEARPTPRHAMALALRDADAPATIDVRAARLAVDRGELVLRV